MQLITIGFNDPRVTSYITSKFAAKMQNENGLNNPVFLDVVLLICMKLRRDEVYKILVKQIKDL